MLKNIEIFKVGKHQDSVGNVQEWTEADLQKIVEQYNSRDKSKPALRAQLVIGHDANSGDLAYGYAEELHYKEGTLFADVVVAPQLVEMVKNHLLQNISISLSEDLQLRHIAFLGAEKPAVKDLAELKFGELKFNDSDKLSIWKTEFKKEIKKINFDYKLNGKDMNMTTEQVEQIVSKYRASHGDKLATELEKDLSPLATKKVETEDKEEDKFNQGNFTEQDKKMMLLEKELQDQKFESFFREALLNKQVLPYEKKDFKDRYDSSFVMNYSENGKALKGIDYLNHILKGRKGTFDKIHEVFNYGEPKNEDDLKFIHELAEQRKGGK